MTKKLGLRIVSGLIFILIILAAVWYVEWGVTLFIFGLAVFASQELFRMFEAKGYHPARYLGITASLSIILLSHFTGTKHHAPFLVTVFILSFAFLIIRGAPWFPYWNLLQVFRPTPDPNDRHGSQMASISDVATTFLGIIYVGWLPAYIPLIRQMTLVGHTHGGVALTYLFFASVAVTDIGAYFAGKRFGKRPLIGPLSPKKTIEGSLGGMAVAVLAAAAIAWGFGLPYGHSMGLALLVSAISQLSDLSESMIKRDAGMKDSGNIIPGHGGVLDRVDSYLLSGAAAYYYLLYIWKVLP